MFDVLANLFADRAVPPTSALLLARRDVPRPTGIMAPYTVEGQVMNKPIPPELISELEKLEDDDVARVVAYAKSLSSEAKLEARNTKLRKLVGSIPSEELEQMRVAIEEGCEQIEHDRW